MDIFSHYFIPDSVFFTIKVESQDFTESKVVFETLAKGLEKMTKHRIAKKRKAIAGYNMPVYVVFEKDDTLVKFYNAKELSLALTGTYDRYIPVKVLKLYINTHLLSGKNKIEHLYREKNDGKMIEF